MTLPQPQAALVVAGVQNVIPCKHKIAGTVFGQWWPVQVPQTNAASDTDIRKALSKNGHQLAQQLLVRNDRAESDSTADPTTRCMSAVIAPQGQQTVLGYITALQQVKKRELARKHCKTALARSLLPNYSKYYLLVSQAVRIPLDRLHHGVSTEPIGERNYVGVF